MAQKQIFSRPVFTVLLVSGLLNIALFSLTARGLASTSAIAPTYPSHQDQQVSQALPDFEVDDDLETAGEGVQAIYVDQVGNVLGTFVNIPGARIKVYANGEIAIDEQDYTQEIRYFSNGRIRTIGNAEFGYFSTGRIREIDGIAFSYFSSGRPRAVGNIDFEYFSSGRLAAIDNVRFEYDSTGQLETISAAQTSSGIRIVVID